MVSIAHLYQRLDCTSLNPLRALQASCTQYLFPLRYRMAGQFYCGSELEER